jgi:hypothetical protein
MVLYRIDNRATGKARTRRDTRLSRYPGPLYLACKRASRRQHATAGHRPQRAVFVPSIAFRYSTLNRGQCGDKMSRWTATPACGGDSIVSVAPKGDALPPVSRPQRRSTLRCNAKPATAHCFFDDLIVSATRHAISGSFRAIALRACLIFIHRAWHSPVRPEFK